MRRFRYLPALPILLGLLLLGGAVPWAGNGPGAGAVPEGTPDPAAASAFARALQALDPERVPALETTIWQQIHLPGLECQVEGRYLLGPHRCYRLELRTTVGRRTGTLLQVSDGTGLWQGLRSSPGRWAEVRHTRIDQALDGPVVPVALFRAADDNLHKLFFCGVGPLLHSLRDRLVWTHQETVSRQGAEYVRLTGEWQTALREALAPAGQPWREALPGACRLWLDAHTFWPCRLEWLGPAQPGEKPVLLAEMELRAPVFNPPLTPERCAAEFHFDPGQTPVLEVGDPTTHDVLVQSDKGSAPGRP
jgi:hypothetical protein